MIKTATVSDGLLKNNGIGWTFNGRNIFDGPDEILGYSMDILALGCDTKEYKSLVLTTSKKFLTQNQHTIFNHLWTEVCLGN